MSQPSPAGPHPRTVLITGASSGIGREIAITCARQGHRLVLVARRQGTLATLAEELGTTHKTQVDVIACDLAVADASASLVDELRKRQLDVDMLVNNAGFATRGLFAATDVEQTEQLLAVNIVALTTLTRLLLPPMLERRYGRILNVASIAGYFPGPLTATYNASKAFVVSFTEALANELQGTGVSATVLCPGPTPHGVRGPGRPQPDQGLCGPRHGSGCRGRGGLPGHDGGTGGGCPRSPESAAHASPAPGAPAGSWPISRASSTRSRATTLPPERSS